MARRSLNKVFLMGNLTRDPVAKYTPNGTMVCVFGIATNRTVKKPDGSTEEVAEFINISSVGKLAEICYKLLAKGMLVFLEGELRTRSWESPTGGKQYRTEVRISDMILIDSKGKTGVGAMAEGETAGAVSAETQPQAEPAEITDAQLEEILEEKPTEESGEKTEEGAEEEPNKKPTGTEGGTKKNEEKSKPKKEGE